MSEPKEKVEVKERPKKPPGYRKFEKLLKVAMTAPPMRRGAGTKSLPDPLRSP